MSFDVKTFRRALGCFATGITVVTAAGTDAGGPFGITINSFTSVSLTPPLVLFCLARASLRLQDLLQATGFVVNVLAEDQGPVSMHFSTPPLQCRWDGVAVARRETGVPVLAGCLAHLVCTPEAIHDGGDHVIVVGRVQSLDWRSEGQPLLYFRGRYGRIGELFVPVTGPSDTPPSQAAARVETVSGDAVAIGADKPSAS